MMAPSPTKKVRILKIGATLLFVTVMVAYVAGTILLMPFRRNIGAPPPDLPLRTVEFPSGSGATLRGWLGLQSGDAAGVVLLHGIRADRMSMIERARFLFLAGYSVLLIDLQAHGESTGNQITLGHLESKDAVSAVEFLRAKTHQRFIGAVGASLGGASFILAEDRLHVDALVVEGVYSDFYKAAENRLRIRLGSIGAWLAPLLTVQLRPRLGISPEELRPVASISKVKAPVLVIAGELDPRTTLADSRELFNAANEPRDLWVVPGAPHVDFHRFNKPEYESKVLSFLQRFMPPKRQPN